MSYNCLEYIASYKNTKTFIKLIVAALAFTVFFIQCVHAYKNFIYENSIGDFEVFLAFCSTAVLATLIYNVITILSFKDLTRRFGLTKISRKDFYECGFRPQSQKVIVVSVQFLLICVFFLLYDIELVFLFPFVSGYTHQG